MVRKSRLGGIGVCTLSLSLSFLSVETCNVRNPGENDDPTSRGGCKYHDDHDDHDAPTKEKRDVP